jgi:hypothetical protein
MTSIARKLSNVSIVQAFDTTELPPHEPTYRKSSATYGSARHADLP